MKNNNQSKPSPFVENDLILSYSILAYDNRVKHLAKLKLELKEENEKMIYEIIKKNKCNTTRDVYDILKNIVDKHNDKIKINVEQRFENGDFGSNKKNEYLKRVTQQPLTLRTIQNIINTLEQKDKLIKKQNRKFDLKDVSDVDIQYIMEEYGKIISGKLYDLSKNSPEDLVKDLVEKFGMILLLIFILIYKYRNDNDIKNIDSDEYIISNSVKDKIPLGDMYTVFSKSLKSIIKNKDNNIKSNDIVTEILLKKIYNSYPSIYTELIKVNKSFELNDIA